MLKFRTSVVSVLPTTCIMFVRVSSKSQTDGVSLEMQKEMIKQWAKDNNIVIIRIYEVVGSGRYLEDNKTFKQMMNFAKTQKKNNCCIAVHSVDRFGRNVISGNAHLFSLLRLGIKFVSVSESLCVASARSPEAHRFTQLMQASDIESTRISERVNSANTYLKKYGWKFGKCPLGKKVVFVETDRSDEKLPPKAIRRFENIPNDQDVMQYVASHSHLHLHALFLQMTELGMQFSGEPITKVMIQKIRKHQKHASDSLVKAMDLVAF